MVHFVVDPVHFLDGMWWNAELDELLKYRGKDLRKVVDAERRADRNEVALDGQDLDGSGWDAAWVIKPCRGDMEVDGVSSGKVPSS